MLTPILAHAQRWSAVFFIFSLLVVLLFPDRGWSHTIAEVLKIPSAFDQLPVTVEGQVAHVVTRYGEAVSTTFDLVGARGEALAILVSGVPECKQDEICKVSGLFVAQRKLLLPETVERIAERPFGRAGVVFQQKGVGGVVSGGRGLREVYIPQE